MEKINGFSGAHRFLSNFQLLKDGKTTEHYYQAAKLDYCTYIWDDARENDRTWVMDSPKPGEARKRGQEVPVIKEDWDAVKISIMEKLLREKFEDEKLREKLLATGDAELVEDNHWGDTFWGECKGIGENNLGKLLMKIRGELNGTAHS